MPDCSEEADSEADDMRQRMTGDDRAQWDAIQEWKAAQISPRSPRVITQRIRSYVLTPLKKTVDLARKVPGGAAIADKTSSAVLGPRYRDVLGFLCAPRVPHGCLLRL